MTPTILTIIVLAYIAAVAFVEYRFKPFRDLYHMGKAKVSNKDIRMRKCTFICGMVCWLFVMILGLTKYTVSTYKSDKPDTQSVSQGEVTTEEVSRERKMEALNSLIKAIRGIDDTMTDEYMLSSFVQFCNKGDLDEFEDTLYDIYVKQYSYMDQAYELTKELDVKVPINLVSGSPASRIVMDYIVLESRIKVTYSDEALYDSQAELAQAGVTLQQYQDLRDSFLYIIDNRITKLRETKYKYELEDYSNMADSLYNATVEFEKNYME